MFIIGAKTYEELIKYRVHAEILVDGYANESDIVGALFGQTEGLLEEEMDFKQLQNSGRIGRIVLKVKKSSGKTTGTIEVPSSLSKVETAIIAATLEQVDRVGPCSASIKLRRIEDVRKEKRQAIAARAAEIMKNWKTSEDVKNLPDKVLKSSKRGKMTKFGPERLAAGPDVYHSEEIILVEGRADVEKLLKYNISNTIELKGSSNIPPSVKTLCKKKIVTAFLDGDRGGDFLLKLLANTVSVDYVARAPKNKEVEDLSKQEVLKALENKVSLLDAELLTERMDLKEFMDKNDHRPQKSRSQSLDRISSSPKKARTSKPSTKRYKRSSKTEEVQTEVVETKEVEPVEPVEKKAKNKRSRYSREKKQRVEKRLRSKPTDSRRDDRGRRRSDDRGRRRSDDRGRRRRSVIKIPDEVRMHAESVKQTFQAVMLDENNKLIASVPTAEAYNSLEKTDSVTSIVIDGVITQRILDLASKKHMKYVVGAVIGDITPATVDKSLTFASYSRLA